MGTSQCTCGHDFGISWYQVPAGKALPFTKFICCPVEPCSTASLRFQRRQDGLDFCMSLLLSLLLSLYECVRRIYTCMVEQAVSVACDVKM